MQPLPLELPFKPVIEAAAALESVGNITGQRQEPRLGVAIALFGRVGSMDVSHNGDRAAIGTGRVAEVRPAIDGTARIRPMQSRINRKQMREETKPAVNQLVDPLHTDRLI